MAGMSKSAVGQPLVNAGIAFGGKAPQQTQAPAPAYGTTYNPAAQNVYSPAFSSQQSAQVPVAAPGQSGVLMPSQMMQRAGLQALMANMMAQYPGVRGSLPMQQPPTMQMPQYMSPALAYRPNLAPAQASLGRVAKSVILQQKEAADAELARLKAENEQLQDQQNKRTGLATYDSGGGG